MCVYLGSRFSCRHVVLKMKEKDLALSFSTEFFKLASEMSQVAV